MAKYHSKKAHFTLNSVDLSSFCNSVEMSEEIEVAETSAFGQDAKTYAEGMSSATINFGGQWDDTATTGLDAVLEGLKTGGEVAFIYGPSGSTGGMIKYTGNCILTNYTRSTPIGDVVAFTATAQVTGEITRGTF